MINERNILKLNIMAKKKERKLIKYFNFKILINFLGKKNIVFCSGGCSKYYRSLSLSKSDIYDTVINNE